jgi:hypothetical protein
MFEAKIPYQVDREIAEAADLMRSGSFPNAYFDEVQPLKKRLQILNKAFLKFIGNVKGTAGFDQNRMNEWTKVKGLYRDFIDLRSKQRTAIITLFLIGFLTLSMSLIHTNNNGWFGGVTMIQAASGAVFVLIASDRQRDWHIWLSVIIALYAIELLILGWPGTWMSVITDSHIGNRLLERGNRGATFLGLINEATPTVYWIFKLTLGYYAMAPALKRDQFFDYKKKHHL